MGVYNTDGLAENTIRHLQGRIRRVAFEEFSSRLHPVYPEDSKVLKMDCDGNKGLQEWSQTLYK